MSITSATRTVPNRLPLRSHLHPALHALIVAAVAAPLGYATVTLALAGAFTVGGAAILALALPVAWTWPLDRALASRHRAFARATISTATWWATIAIVWEVAFLPIGNATGHSEWTILVGSFIGGILGTLLSRATVRARPR